MSGFDLDVSELNDLARELGRASVEKKKEATRVVQQVGAEAHSRARAAAPKDRPWLSRQGIRRKTWKPEDGVHVDIFTTPDPQASGDDAKRNVGFYVEYGTSDTDPQPFLGPQGKWAEPVLMLALADILDPFEDNPKSEIPDD